MRPNAAGRTAITRVRLRPDVRFGGASRPDRAQLDQLHHDAHAQCFIANSVLTDIVCEPVYAAP